MKYFSNCKTIEDVKRTFHECAKRLHPDAGGDAAAFRDMMTEYNMIFDRLKNIHVNAAGETYEKETKETPEQFAEIIEKIIHFDGVKIEIIGSWIWLSGNTMTYKDDIKRIGFIWSKNKKAWYYTGDQEHKRRRGHFTMDQLRSRFDTQEIDPEPQKKIS